MPSATTRCRAAMMLGGACSLGWLTALVLPCFDVFPHTLLGNMWVAAGVAVGTVAGVIEHTIRYKS